MDRLERMRELVDVAGGRGLEIGPLLRPTVTPDMGTIFYADHASTEELRAKYRDDPDVDVDAITPVDFVCGSIPLAAAAKSEAPFDYVLASHVIEHVPDLVGWLADVQQVLRPGGRLSLCIPDRRYSFDVRRRCSDVSEAVEAHLLGLRRPAVRATFDHFYRHVDVDAVALWHTDVRYDDHPLNPTDAMDLSTLSARSETYLDTHCWVVSDTVFLSLYRELASLGLVELEVVSATATQLDDHEFFVTLERLPEDLPADEVRRRVLASIPDLQPVPRPADSPAAPEPVGQDGRDYRLSEREISAVELKRLWATRARRVLTRLADAAPGR